MSRLVVKAVLAAGLFGVGCLPAGAMSFGEGYGGAGGPGFYRPLPPVSGTLRPGRRGLYGDRTFGSLHYRSSGFGGEGFRRGGFHRFAGRGAVVRDRAAYAGVRGGYAYGYGAAAPAAPAVYAGQDFVPEAAGTGYGVSGYDQVGPSVGFGGGGFGYNTGCGGCGVRGGGVGFFTQGAYGGGPRVIEIAQPYTVTYRHVGCGCGSSGLFGSFGGY